MIWIIIFIDFKTQKRRFLFLNVSLLFDEILLVIKLLLKIFIFLLIFLIGLAVILLDLSKF